LFQGSPSARTALGVALVLSAVLLLAMRQPHRLTPLCFVFVISLYIEIAMLFFF